MIDEVIVVSDPSRSVALLKKAHAVSRCILFGRMAAERSLKVFP
jgi:hypothetical protein